MMAGLASQTTLSKPTCPAVQVAGNPAGIVVGRQGIGLSVQGERAVGDAVSVAADQGPEVGGVRDVLIDRIVAEDNIVQVRRGGRAPAAL